MRRLVFDSLKKARFKSGIVVKQLRKPFDRIDRWLELSYSFEPRLKANEMGRNRSILNFRADALSPVNGISFSILISA